MCGGGLATRVGWLAGVISLVTLVSPDKILSLASGVTSPNAMRASASLESRSIVRFETLNFPASFPTVFNKAPFWRFVESRRWGLLSPIRT